jgi:hypothetical protein
MATMSDTRQTVGALAVTAAALVRGLVAAGPARRRRLPHAPVGRRATSVSARVSALPDSALVFLPPMAR